MIIWVNPTPSKKKKKKSSSNMLTILYMSFVTQVFTTDSKLYIKTKLFN